MNNWIAFSDAAKYADVARNLINGDGYKTTFSFFLEPLFTGQWITPVMPFSIAASFKIFGVNDFAVIATSLFYFVLSLIFIFLLTRRLFNSNLVASLSSITVAFNYDLIHYASSGASESPFIFEIVAASYFVSLRKKWGNLVVTIFLIFMYFTRPQAFIYIAGIILYWLLINFKIKKALIYFGLICAVGFLADRFILTRLSGKYFLYSVLGRGSNVLSQVGVGQSASDQLRSGVLTYNFSIIDFFKKVFYNMYNFYNLLPQIINPYLFVLFVIGLFRKDNRQFKTASLFMIVATFLVTAASIPFFRYIHPVIPVIYIVAVATMVEITKTQIANYKRITIYKIQISKQTLLVLASCILMLFFSVGQTLGIIFLDSRFERNTHNVGKPPIYVALSQILKDNTNVDQVVVTNLDTWGSWYGERKTVWFPLEPKMLIDPATGDIPFSAIYLTSYLMDDENYYMGEGWRMIFNNPANPEKWACDGCQEIAEDFALKGTYAVDPGDNYQRESAKAVLLVRK